VTEIAFHFGAPDKIAYVCRLLRKAVASGAHVEVVSDVPTRQRLNADLWALSPTDFLVHCDEGASSLVREFSAVLMTSTPSQEHGRRPVLVNLCETVPPGFDRFQRLIEVVCTDEADRQHARNRWKYYAQAGYKIVRHDLALKSNTQ